MRKNGNTAWIVGISWGKHRWKTSVPLLNRQNAKKTIQYKDEIRAATISRLKTIIYVILQVFQTFGCSRHLAVIIPDILLVWHYTVDEYVWVLV